MIIAIGSDHAGFELKTDLIKFIKRMGIECMDYGTDNLQAVDYPDFGQKIARDISRGKIKKGILICGTGIGMSIVANKFPNVRAALCNEVFSAKMSRLHNNANILVLGSRIIGKDLAKAIVEVWLETKFEGNRHSNRLQKILIIENNIFKI